MSARVLLALGAGLAACTAAAAPVELPALFESLTTARGLVQAAAVLLCLMFAWSVLRLLRGNDGSEDDLWFGARIVDGVLFPVLAWCLVLGAEALLERTMPVPLLQLALPLLLSLAVIRGTVRVLRMAYPESRRVRIVERTVSWLVWGAAAAWLTGTLPLLLAWLDALHWHVGGADVSVRRLLEGGITAAVVLLVTLWLSAMIERSLLRGAVDNLSVRKIAANTIRAGLLLLGVLFALSAAGIPFGALGVLSGALGVGIGFGLQKLASNYVSGFVILAERSLRIGDMVKVDQFEGRITDIKTRYTVIRALNGRESIVPNEVLVTSRVENASFADRQLLLQCTVQVGYDTDVEALLPALVATVQAVPRVLATPAPNALLTAFAPDGLELGLFFWIDDPENGQANVRSAVNLAVLRRLREAGVAIPYPQRVLHSAPTAGTPPQPGAASPPRAP